MYTNKFLTDFSTIRRTQRIEKSIKDHALSQEEKEKIDNDYFDFFKNLTILSGTIFASSVVLASGKNVNIFFFLGELFLFLSTVFGIVLLWSQLRGREWLHFFMLKIRLQSELNFDKDTMEDFEIKILEDNIARYEKIMDRKDLTYYLLKLISVDRIPTIFFSLLILGLFLILISILDIPDRLNLICIESGLSSVTMGGYSGLANKY